MSGQVEKTAGRKTAGRKTESGQTARAVDRYSFELGVMDCFCEMVKAGAKTMAMSHPWDTREERDGYLPAVEALCGRYQVHFYPEEELPITGLFPEELCRGKFLFLFYRDAQVLERYLKLKENAGKQAEAGENGVKDLELATEFGRLLSYPEDGIERRIKETSLHKEDLACRQKQKH